MIKKINPYFTHRPNVGDIILGEPEFNFGRIVNDIIEVGVDEVSIVEKQIIEEIWSKDKLFKVPSLCKVDVSNNDETRQKSCWVIIETKILKDINIRNNKVIESWYVVAQRMKNDEIDTGGEIIHFYTCGNKQNLIDKKFEVVANYEKV